MRQAITSTRTGQVLATPLGDTRLFQVLVNINYQECLRMSSEEKDCNVFHRRQSLVKVIILLLAIHAFKVLDVGTCVRRRLPGKVCVCELLWGVEPHDIPNGEQWGSQLGPPPPDRRFGCTGPGRSGLSGSGLRPHEGDLMIFVCKATKGEAGLKFGREGVDEGLVEALYSRGA